MQREIVLTYKTGELKPDTTTLRIVAGVHYAVSSCGAWVRISPRR
jgi:hypothetical protein